MSTETPATGGAEALDANGLQFGIDWFAFTVKDQPRNWVVNQLVEALGEEWKEWEMLRRSDRREKTTGPYGSLIEVDWREKWVHVVIKGKGCRAVGTGSVVFLHEVLFLKMGEAYRPTRVDLAWDDFRKRITPKQFRERFCDLVSKKKRPEVVCKARGGRAIEDDGPEGGGSYTVGTRQSNRLLRVYDKAAESGGKVDAVRIELECKEWVAADVMNALMKAPVGERSGAAVRFLVGFIDFRESRGGLQVGKRPRSAWWSELVGAARKAELTKPERLGMEQWRSDFTQRNSSGFRMLIDLNGGAIEQAAFELMTANLRDNPRHRAWHRKRKAERDAKRWQKTGDEPVAVL